MKQLPSLISSKDTQRPGRQPDEIDCLSLTQIFVNFSVCEFVGWFNEINTIGGLEGSIDLLPKKFQNSNINYFFFNIIFLFLSN